MGKILIFIITLLSVFQIHAQYSFPKNEKEDREKIMSKAYWKIWDPQVQKQIDQDIEKNRKANGELILTDIAPNAEVKIEQISHDFVFGAHIFNFNQLGKKEYNDKYKELYGTLFNSATVAFYWKTFEMQPNRPRFKEEYWDTENFWNNAVDPKNQPHWRRPATDPIVEFCESKDIRMLGHAIIWGNRKWQNPSWILQNCMTPEEKIKMDLLIDTYGDVNKVLTSDQYKEVYKSLTAEQLEEMFPELAKTLMSLYEKRIINLAEYYGDRIHRWDVVNESVGDYEAGRLIPESNICKSVYDILMPGDYTYKSLQIAEKAFPENVLFSINDNVSGVYNHDTTKYYYADQAKNLIDRGCKVNVIGSQMHLFNPQECLDIAAGKEIQTPTQIYDLAKTLSTTSLPIHMSEITITSPGNDTHGREIQAIIAQNLYRLWFSLETVMGITWWNVVDDCGAPGEASVSGIFTRDMVAKPAYYALNNLINNEWKSKMTAKPDKNGRIKFRGFKGNYRITWKDNDGNMQTREYYLK